MFITIKLLTSYFIITVLRLFVLFEVNVIGRNEDSVGMRGQKLNKCGPDNNNNKSKKTLTAYVALLLLQQGVSLKRR